MNDRELLELAAKAAGYRIEWCAEFPGGGCYMKTVVPEPPAPFSQRVPWNPLTDDGDALRLAVRLNLLSSPEFRHYLSLERFSGQDRDDITAHRRAITRTAAEIGSTLK